MTINGQQRIIEILLRLLEGEKLSKQGLMHDYGKQESTIQRDIGMIESVLHDALKVSPIGVLNREEKGNYYLQGNYLAKDFKEEEILALLKILLSTRIFSKNDLARLKADAVPNEYDVLACLEKYDPGTFEDFCSELGYDEDSRTAERIYIAVIKEYKDLTRIFTEKQMEELSEIQ